MRLLGLALTALLSAPAFAADVRVITPGEVDPTTLGTYDFFLHDSKSIEGPYAQVLIPRLVDLATETLAEKGYRRDTEDPDFLITYDGQISDSLTIWGGHRTKVKDHVVWEFHAGYYQGLPAREAQGLLVLRMHLPGDDEPFWAGAYTVQIAGRLDTDRIWKKARKAANKILAEYPAR